VKKLALLLASLAFALLAGCGGSNKGSPADPPADFHVQSGDGSVIVSWTAEPGVEYWIFFGVGPDITTTNWATRGGVVLTNAQSPRIITGLQNGVTYSFTINGRKDKGPGGAGAPTQAVTPTVAGENWQPGLPLGSQELNGITAGTLANGFDVVVVGDAGALYSSVGAAPYTARTNPAAGVNLNGAVFGFAGFLAVGDNGTILHSPNSVDWTQQTSGTTARLNGGVSSSTAQYVVVGSGGTVVTSGDAGSSWTTPGTPVPDQELLGATWGAQRFVAVGTAGTILAGESGADWVQVGQSLTTATLRGAAYGAIFASGATTATNIYVIVGDAGTVLTSSDSISWTLQPPFTTRNLRAVTYGGRFVAVGEDGVIFTSPEGVTWTERASGTTADLNGVARQISGYTAVGEAGTNVSTF
jgi:hypothetical protein